MRIICPGCKSSLPHPKHKPEIIRCPNGHRFRYGSKRLLNGQGRVVIAQNHPVNTSDCCGEPLTKMKQWQCHKCGVVVESNTNKALECVCGARSDDPKAKRIVTVKRPRKTTATYRRGEQSLSGDPGRLAKPTVLHCCYHVCALKKNDLWLQNVRQLLKRKDVFTGRRVAAIACGEGIHDPRVVQEAFAGSGFEFILSPNDKKLREVATFIPLLKKVECTLSDEAVFYAHTKGNSTADDVRGSIYWRNAAYHHLLDRADICVEAMRTYPTVGIHKMCWEKSRKPPYPTGLRWGYWMWAGTFFWFRSDAVFLKPNWRDIPIDRYGAEAWIGHLIPSPRSGFSMYQLWPEYSFPNISPYNPKVYVNPIEDDVT